MAKRLIHGPAAPMWLVDNVGDVISESNPLPIGDGWEIVTARDETDDNSNKALAVPADYIWHVLSVRVFFTADGNAGDRQIAIRLSDNGGVVLDEVIAGTTQAAAEARYYEFAPSLADLTDFRDTDWIMTPIPPTWILQPLHHIVVLDRNIISAGGDDMHVYYRYARRAL